MLVYIYQVKLETTLGSLRGSLAWEFDRITPYGAYSGISTSVWAQMESWRLLDLERSIQRRLYVERFDNE